MKKPLAAAATLALAVGMGAGLGAASAPAPAAAVVNYCGITWGSTPEHDAGSSINTVKNVRSGRHDCFDRLVIDTRGAINGYDVRYVSEVREEGSGFPVPLRGGADLQVTIHNPAYTAAGNPSFWPEDYDELTDVEGYNTFRQVAYAGSFEGQTTLGLGVRARLPFRVFILDGPGSGERLVIDVAHYW